ELRRMGPLAPVWQRLDRDEPRCALAALPARHDLEHLDPGLALGRRWRHERPDFWERLSPLGIRSPSVSADEEEGNMQPADPEVEAFSTRLRQLREANLAEARRDAAAFGFPNSTPDLRPSAIDGSMDDHEGDIEEERWR